MTWKKYVLFAAAGTLLVLLAFSFFLHPHVLDSHSAALGSDDEDAQEESGGEGVAASHGDVAISNDVENNINGDNADIDNAIENHVNHGKNTNVDNNVTNQIDVNVDVNVANNIVNKAEGEAKQEDDDSSHDDYGDNGGNGNGNGDENGESNDNGNGNGDEHGESNGNGNGNENGNDDGNDNNETDENGEIVWGVDTANLTDDDFQSCVEDNFGEPQVWGRYLGDKEDVSRGLTSDEVERIHATDAQILVIWNHFTDGTGYENGQSEANEAIDMARDFGIPEDVALFANVEPIYPIDADFITGWYDALQESEYEAGVYGVFDPEQEVYTAFEAAVEDDADILENTYIWTSAPEVGVTTEEEAPEYQPEAPADSLAWGWQYGLEADTCEIDTNLFKSDLLNVLW